MSSWKRTGNGTGFIPNQPNNTKGNAVPRGLPPGITQEMLDNAKAMKAEQGAGGKSRAYGRGGAPMSSPSRGRGATHSSSPVSHASARGGESTAGMMGAYTVGRLPASPLRMKSPDTPGRSQVAAPAINASQSSTPALPKSTARMVNNGGGVSSSNIGHESTVRISRADKSESVPDARCAPSQPTAHGTYVAPHLINPSTIVSPPTNMANLSALTNANATTQSISLNSDDNGPKRIVSNMVPHDPLEFVAAHFLRQKSAKQVKAEIDELVQRYEAEEGKTQGGGSTATSQVSGSLQTTFRSSPSGHAQLPIRTSINNIAVAVRNSTHAPRPTQSSAPVAVTASAESIKSSGVHLFDGYVASLLANPTKAAVDVETTKTIEFFADPTQVKKDVEFPPLKTVEMFPQTPLLAKKAIGLHAWAAFTSGDIAAQDAIVTAPVSTPQVSRNVSFSSTMDFEMENPKSSVAVTEIENDDADAVINALPKLGASRFATTNASPGLAISGTATFPKDTTFKRFNVKTKEIYVASSSFLTPAYDERDIARALSIQSTEKKENIPKNGAKLVAAPATSALPVNVLITSTRYNTSLPADPNNPFARLFKTQPAANFATVSRSFSDVSSTDVNINQNDARSAALPSVQRSSPSVVNVTARASSTTAIPAEEKRTLKNSRWA